MKKSSRKRLLVSSVAMLLVAMLALGTATFAWFTTDSAATADGLSVKTVKSSELKLSGITGDWTDHLQYGFSGRVLKPASSADGVNWFKATAASKTSYAADDDTVESAGTYSNEKSGIADYVFMQQLNVANFGGAEVTGVKITATLSEEAVKTGKKYLRMAIVPVENRGTSSAMATMATTGANSFAQNVYAVGTDTANAIKTASGGTVGTEAVAAKDGSSLSINVGALAGSTTAGQPGGVKYYNLFVWFEGQDEDCADANAGNEMPGIEFSVSGKTAEQTPAA